MARVLPFCGYRFRDPATGSVAPCIAPPYDVLDQAERDRFAARSSANVVHLTLPAGAPEQGGDRYASARALLLRMVADGRLARDPRPRVYRQDATFRVPGGGSATRRGVLAAVGVEPISPRGAIRGHEQVLPKPLEDRTRLLQATRANLEPVFLLYRDPDGAIGALLDADAAASREAPVDASLDDVRFTCAPVGETASSALARRLADAPLYIADGHHRFTVSARFHAETQGAADLPSAGFRLALLVRAEDAGLVVLPTHRFVAALDDAQQGELERRLEQDFDLHPVAPERLLAPGAAGPGTATRGAFGVWLRRAGRSFVAAPRARAFEALAAVAEPLRSLDVTVLHRALLAPPLDAVPVTYVRGEDDPLGLANERDVAAAIFLRAPPVATVLEVSDKGQTMPPKSTYFFPKAASGQVLLRLDEPLDRGS